MKEPLHNPGFWIFLVSIGLLVLLEAGCLIYCLVSILISAGPNPWLP